MLLNYGWLRLFNYEELKILQLRRLLQLWLEKTLETPLDCKVIQPVYPKAKQSWIFIGRTDAEAETPVLWPPAKNWLIWKDPDAGKDWRWEEKGMAEDEMVGWHHWLDGYGFGWTLGFDDGQGCLECCGSWGCKEVRHDWVTELNWFKKEVNKIYASILLIMYCVTMGKLIN